MKHRDFAAIARYEISHTILKHSLELFKRYNFCLRESVDSREWFY